jgi:hypothetical protein
MTRALAVLAAVLVPAAAWPQELADFARGIEIRAEGGSSIYRVPLPDDVYSTVTRPDAGDVRVFNAAGEPVPHALREAPAPEASIEPLVNVPSFPISEKTAAGSDLAAVKIDERGTVLEVRRAPAPGETVSTYLVDVSALKTAIVGLALIIEDARGASFLARVGVQGSDDLNRWRTIVPAAVVARMRHGDYLLTQNEIELPPTRVRYLRISWPKELAGMTLVSARVRPESATPAAEIRWRTLTGRPTSDANEAAVYEAGGHFPIEHLDLEFADAIDAVSVTIQSRPDESSDWLVRYSGLFYALSENGDTIRNTPARIGRVADREWLLEPAGNATWRPERLPRLKVGWRPHRLLFLARGSGPYTLAYGNARIDSQDAPVDTLLASLGRADSSERIADATLGDPRDLAGIDALTPPRPWRQMTLWAVLIVAVLVLGGFARGVLRDRPGPGGRDGGARTEGERSRTRSLD